MTALLIFAVIAVAAACEEEHTRGGFLLGWLGSLMIVLSL